MKKLLCAVWLAVATAVSASDSSNAIPHIYPSGFSLAMKLGTELYEALPPNLQKQVYVEPVSLDTRDTPCIVPIAQADDDKVQRQVAASVGFIDLLNHVAHAKAIDHIEPGYFAKYVETLSHCDTNGQIPEVPNISDDRYWTEDVMNEQLSYFNQMFGLIIAVNLSHHYLGSYDKHAAQLGAGTVAPINSVLTAEEWNAAFRAGALNALNCAMGAEGVHALLEAIGKMPRRPAWTTYIVPPTADLQKLNKTLAKYEDDYFHGRMK